MTEGVNERLGFSAVGGREAKAQKIAAILAAAGYPLKPADKVLDLGCGSGAIAATQAKDAGAHPPNELPLDSKQPETLQPSLICL